MKKHYFLLWKKETASFRYFYHEIIFYSAEVFDFSINSKFQWNIFEHFFWTWTQIKHQRSNIWIKKQPFISGSAVQRGFGSKVTGLQFHRCFILYWCFEDFGHIFPICFCKTSHNLICKEFAILKNIKLAKILEVGKISSYVTSLSTLFREW